MIFLSGVLEEGHLNALVPYPTHYRLVWQSLSGDNKLFAWKAHPPPSPKSINKAAYSHAHPRQPHTEPCLKWPWVSSERTMAIGELRAHDGHR